MRYIGELYKLRNILRVVVTSIYPFIATVTLFSASFGIKDT